MTPRVHATAVWAALALGAVATAALEPVSAAALGPELDRLERQRHVLRRLLGNDRWRSLDAARFEVELHSRPAISRLSDHPRRQEAIERIFLHSLAKLSQKAVERRLHLIERRDAWRARLRGCARAAPRRRLDVSPRVRLGTDPWLGLKLRMTGTDSPLWSRTSLRVGSELDGKDPSVKLEFESLGRRGFLAYHPDDAERGEAIELQIGFSF